MHGLFPHRLARRVQERGSKESTPQTGTHPASSRRPGSLEGRVPRRMAFSSPFPRSACSEWSALDGEVRLSEQSEYWRCLLVGIIIAPPVHVNGKTEAASPLGRRPLERHQVNLAVGVRVDSLSLLYCKAHSRFRYFALKGESNRKQESRQNNFR